MDRTQAPGNNKLVKIKICWHFVITWGSEKGEWSRSGDWRDVYIVIKTKNHWKWLTDMLICCINPRNRNREAVKGVLMFQLSCCSPCCVLFLVTGSHAGVFIDSSARLHEAPPTNKTRTMTCGCWECLRRNTWRKAIWNYALLKQKKKSSSYDLMCIDALMCIWSLF